MPGPLKEEAWFNRTIRDEEEELAIESLYPPGPEREDALDVLKKRRQARDEEERIAEEEEAELRYRRRYGG